ncbi:transposase [Mycoplasma sp. P36-A1]|uniref:transposase n=1 Tax=Mycoplasma sp. P36-A1 TaxID=3252900 RepID=UPI003C2B3928
MAKYSLELKLKLKNECKNKRKSITNIAKSNNIDRLMLRKWIRHFEGKGVNSLKKSRTNKIYDQDFKFMVVKEYLTSSITYLDLAMKYDINNYAMIAKWKIDYEKDGIIGLQTKKKGRPTTMPIDKPKTDNITKQEKLDDKQKIKELELKLEIVSAENALLKKFHALGIPIPEEMLKK